jgi:ubiquinone/menaquinone biosynthesis C-methylase UbiE
MPSLERALDRVLGRAWLFDLGAGFYAWFSSNALWRESNARLAAYFPRAQPARRLRVLDLGCGPGITAITLAQQHPDAHVIGLDIAPRMLDIAQRRTGQAVRAAQLTRPVPYILADATALPFATDSIDVTTGHSFLYLVPDRNGVLAEAYRVLRPGGRYVSMEPRDGSVEPGYVRRHWHDLRFLISIALWRPYSKYHGRFHEKSFPETLQRAGFKNTGTESVLGSYGIIGYGEK